MKVFAKVLFLVIIFTSFLIAQVPWSDQLRSKSVRPPTDYNPVPKKSGHYTAKDWATVIDTTWGEGLPTADKLQIFDLFWNKIDEDYAGFQNLDVNWDSLKTVYRPEIAAGISRGRFSGIMNRLATALMEFHTHIYDKEVRGDSLKPGVPLLAYHSAYTVYDNGHFGAGLTPLPDSSALVYTVVDNHPLGLEQGDIILGYDGIPWKYLYQDLLDAELPTTHPHPNVGVGSSEKSVSHLWLMSAGLNWHLFDTVDILKFGSTDTLHLPTSVLIDQNMQIFCSEQLPVQGVPMVDLSKFFESAMVSWGIVEGTQIGYIYVSRWRDKEDEAFRNAVNSIIANDQITGLILDFRGNPGGHPSAANEGFSRLFNFNLNVLEFAERSDPNDHFAMRPVPSGYCSGEKWRFNADTYLFDKPIAVLTGPMTFSAGDYNALRLKYHPMVSIFGKPTNTAFTCFTITFHNLDIPYEEWLAGYAPKNTYLSDDPDNFLMHVGFEVDEEVWFTQEDVARGEDTVVKKAIEWINNLAHAHDVTVNKIYAKPGTDTVIVTAQVENPNQHQLSLTTDIHNLDDVFIDSLSLFDDGTHGDGTANDNLWGNFYLPTGEQSFKVSVTTNDISDETSRTLPKVAWFTTIGPIVYDSWSPYIVEDSVANPGDILSFKLHLKNKGLVSTAEEIEARLYSNNLKITVHNFYSTYGDIGAGSMVESNHGYSFEISSDFSQDTTIYLTINISSEGYQYWSDSIAVPVIVTGIFHEGEQIPKTYALKQNYPNPFNPKTMINYQLPMTSEVELSIYNLLGQKVVTLVNKKQNPGIYHVEWDASSFASGIYFYRIDVGDPPGRTGEFQQVRKMVLLK